MADGSEVELKKLTRLAQDREQRSGMELIVGAVLVFGPIAGAVAYFIASAKLDVADPMPVFWATYAAVVALFVWGVTARMREIFRPDDAGKP